ncbi:hypothetical protein IJ00_23930 [Calothrix sp. 336/3]|nr:hypothetical protein IJ00_23930 [Calothrix sp. 336/3]
MLKNKYRGSSWQFERIAAFPVYLNNDVKDETVAEIVAASKDGKTLVYTDSQTKKLCFVNITNPAKPEPGGCVQVGGEPTSVAVRGIYALVAVNTSQDFKNPSGKLLAVNIQNRSIAREILLNGQPDSVAVSPDGKYAAIAIENERDEDLGNGAPPQLPGGFLNIVDLADNPNQWSLRNVTLDGVADLFPTDAEPEYVDINDKNIAVVTLQENNHIVLVDLPKGTIIKDFSAGTVDLTQIDTKENKLIELNSSLTGVPREPDGVNWISRKLFATADEGDLNGGSRGMTIFNTDGHIIYTSGNSVEHEMVRLGHYPENRSENKGNEPENVEFGVYGKEQFLFLGSERSSVVLVYRLNQRYGKQEPELVQVLPTGVAPEGLLAIPQRNLFVVASEEDARADKVRSSLSIYQLSKKSNYPQIVSGDRSDNTPIPWAGLSGLAASQKGKNTVFTIHDSFYNKSRIYAMDVEQVPAVINQEIILNDSLGKLKTVAPQQVNSDGSVNLDLEGIEVRQKGGFWLVSEGAGSVNEPSRPVTSLNLLLQVSSTGVIEEVIQLPKSVSDRQRRFGFEGVAAVGEGDKEVVYVAFQREWVGDSSGFVRIGRYETTTANWTFYYYPLDQVTSPNGGWVGLSELTYLGKDKFAVVERDDQGNTDARIKRIYEFSITGVTPQADTNAPNFPVVTKKLVRDLLPDLQSTGGLVLEKIEGMTVLRNGTTLVVTDNDGVDGSNGETQLLRF